jgi:hypothetical protein
MRYLPLLCLLFVIACNNQSGTKNEATSDTVTKKDTTVTDITPPPAVSDPTVQLLENMLVQQGLNDWHVVNDSTAGWPKDEFDYFIAPKRKTEPLYPYIAKSDFDADGNPDMAALVKSKNNQFMILIARNYHSDKAVLDQWKEDIDLCALSVFPKGDLDGIKGEKVKLKSDAIGVEYFEKSSFVVYWDGKKFKRVWTGD